MRYYLVMSILTFCLVMSVHADTHTAETESDTLYTVTLTDGSRINGRITARSHDSITMQTPSGVEMRIPHSTIESIQATRGRDTNGNVRRYDPNSGRLVYMPTGRPRRAGEFIFANHMLFLPSITYGFTDNIGVLAGMSILPGVGFGDQLLYAAPRVGYAFTETTAATAGAMFVHVEEEDVGIMFATGTFGPPDKSLTIGYGVPFSLGEEISTTGIFTVGGELQLTNSLALISENWFVIGEEGHLFSGGVRLFGDNLSVDFVGLFNEDIGGFPIPWVSLSYTWGK